MPDSPPTITQFMPSKFSLPTGASNGSKDMNFIFAFVFLKSSILCLYFSLSARDRPGDRHDCPEREERRARLYGGAPGELLHPRWVLPDDGAGAGRMSSEELGERLGVDPAQAGQGLTDSL